MPKLVRGDGSYTLAPIGGHLVPIPAVGGEAVAQEAGCCVPVGQCRREGLFKQ